jgi:hypothetical protein
MAFDFTETDSASITTTEYFLASDSTTKTSQTDDAMVQLWCGDTSIAAGDVFEVKLYEKVNAVEFSQVLGYLTVDAKSFISPAFILGDGWEFSLRKISGTNRTINWSLRKAT